MPEEKTKLPIVCMQVRVKRWPGQTKLQAEDLDLEESDVAENIVLGHRKLYPEDWRAKFSKIQGKAINYLKSNSLPFLLDNVRAVPRMRIDKIVTNLNAFKAQYMELVEEFCDSREEIIIQMLQDYPDTFKANDIPERAKLRKKFDMWWAIFEVKGPDTSELDSEELIEAYNQAQQEVNEKMAQFVEESVILLRKKIGQTVEALAKKLADGKVIKNSSIESVKSIHSWFKELNVFGDKDIDAALDKLKNALPEDAAFFKGNKDLQMQVSKLADEVMKKAVALDDLGEISGKYVRVVEVEEEAA
jgi:hypothetical protein